jgi:hypothetical protein
MLPPKRRERTPCDSLNQHTVVNDNRASISRPNINKGPALCVKNEHHFNVLFELATKSPVGVAFVFLRRRCFLEFIPACVAG